MFQPPVVSISKCPITFACAKVYAFPRSLCFQLCLWGWDFLFGCGVSVSNSQLMSLLAYWTALIWSDSCKSWHPQYPLLLTFSACHGEEPELHPHFCVWNQQACIDEAAAGDVPHVWRTMQAVRQEDGIKLIKGLIKVLPGWDETSVSYPEKFWLLGQLCW